MTELIPIAYHLFQGVPFYKSPNVGGLLIQPQFIIIHYTAGSAIRQTRNTFLNKNSKVSAHLAIDRDGSIEQYVPFDRIAWHAGSTYWNRVGFGIEMENAGRMGKNIFGKFVRNRRMFNPDDLHIETNGKYAWEKFTEPALQSLERVIASLRAVYGALELKGHSEVSKAKIDPGPCFPWSRFR